MKGASIVVGHARCGPGHFGPAHRTGARVAVIIGENEAADGVVTVRDLSTSQQEAVPRVCELLGRPDLIELNSEPVFDGMRADPRFIELMRRVGWRV